MIDTLSSRLPTLKSEGGFTLIELLVSSALALVLFTALFTLLNTSQRVQARDTEWALTMQEGRAGLARMTREIRQASSVEEAKPNTIVFLATFGGKYWKVEYNCAVTQTTSLVECERLAVEGATLKAAKEAALPSKGEALIRDILKETGGKPTEVFSYFKGTTATTTASEVDIVTLKTPLHAVGELKQIDNSGYANKEVVLENAAFIRNLYLAG
jgi:prepilin-type N-terminal cleavage/methylation domain-containing protein